MGDNKQIAQANTRHTPGRRKSGQRARLFADRGARALPDHLEDVRGRRAALGARCDGEDLSARRVLRSHQGSAIHAQLQKRLLRSKRFPGFLASLTTASAEAESRRPAAAGDDRPPRARRGLWRPGRSVAGRSAGGSGSRRRLRSFLAPVLRAGDALRHVELPRALSRTRPSIHRW